MSRAGYEISDVIPPAEPRTPATKPATTSKMTFATEITTPTTLPHEQSQNLRGDSTRHTLEVPKNANVSIRELSLEESQLIRDARRPATGWALDFPTDGDVRVAAYYAGIPPAPTPEPWTSLWLIVESDLVVGMLGFKGEPLANQLEVGYGIAPSVRGRGVTTQALAQLLDLIKHRGLKVRAETAVWNIPSQSVLRHLHFKEVGRRNDPGDGDLIVWELFGD